MRMSSRMMLILVVVVVALVVGAIVVGVSRTRVQPGLAVWDRNNSTRTVECVDDEWNLSILPFEAHDMGLPPLVQCHSLPSMSRDDDDDCNWTIVVDDGAEIQRIVREPTVVRDTWSKEGAMLEPPLEDPRPSPWCWSCSLCPLDPW